MPIIVQLIVQNEDDFQRVFEALPNQSVVGINTFELTDQEVDDPLTTIARLERELFECKTEREAWRQCAIALEGPALERLTGEEPHEPPKPNSKPAEIAFMIVCVVIVLGALLLLIYLGGGMS